MPIQIGKCIPDLCEERRSEKDSEDKAETSGEFLRRRRNSLVQMRRVDACLGRRYAIAPCDAEEKWVEIGLSEDI
eukprot:4640070-Prorocentrum_lima.AAC.1